MFPATPQSRQIKEGISNRFLHFKDRDQGMQIKEGSSLQNQIEQSIVSKHCPINLTVQQNDYVFRQSRTHSNRFLQLKVEIKEYRSRKTAPNKYRRINECISKHLQAPVVRGFHDHNKLAAILYHQVAERLLHLNYGHYCTLFLHSKS